MSEEFSAAPHAQAVDFAGQQPLDPAADDEANVPQPLDSEILSVTERDGLLYMGGKGEKIFVIIFLIFKEKASSIGQDFLYTLNVD